MKTFTSILFLVVAAFFVAEALPRIGEEEVVIVPLEARATDSSEESSEESGEDESFFHFGVPSFSFFSSFDDFMRRTVGHLKDLFSSAGSRPGLGEVANATSVQKVVNGHVVTINDTTYKQNDTDSLFFIRVIDIKPTELDTDAPPAAEAEEGEVETIQGSKSESSNEISQGQTEDVAGTVNNNHSERAELLERREYYPDYDVDNSIDIFDTKPISLEGDTLVNKVKHDQTKGGLFMVPHDVEVFDVLDGKAISSHNSYNPYQISQRTEKIVT